MSDMIKIRLHVGTGFAGCSHDDYEEVSRELWNAMTDTEREYHLAEAANDFLANRIEWSAWVEDDE